MRITSLAKGVDTVVIWFLRTGYKAAFSIMGLMLLSGAEVSAAFACFATIVPWILPKVVNSLELPERICKSFRVSKTNFEYEVSCWQKVFDVLVPVVAILISLLLAKLWPVVTDVINTDAFTFFSFF